MVVSRTTAIVLVIPASGKNTPGDGEQRDAGQYKQDKFHKLHWFKSLATPDKARRLPQPFHVLNVAAMGCSPHLRFWNAINLQLRKFAQTASRDKTCWCSENSITFPAR